MDTKLAQWSYLPNSAHLLRILASSKTNLELWVGSWSLPEDRHESVNVAWDMAWDIIENDVHDDVIRAAFQNAGSWKIRMAFAALVAWDDCAYMLDSVPDELAILAKLGDPRAVLLLPACIAFAKEKEKVK